MRFAFLALALLAAACSPPSQTAASSAAMPPVESAAAPASSAAPAIEPAASAPASSAAPAAKGVAAAWKVDAAASAIGFTANHKTLGPLKANFKGWSAQIVFDPGDLAHSAVSVTIPTAGVKTGQELVDSAWPEAEWFDVKAHPNATFTATSFKSLGGDKYQADGTLNVKGKPYPTTLPFTLKIAGNAATATAALTLDRAKLNIGMQSDAAGEWVDKSVAVNIKVQATKG